MVQVPVLGMMLPESYFPALTFAIGRFRFRCNIRGVLASFSGQLAFRQGLLLGLVQWPIGMGYGLR